MKTVTLEQAITIATEDGAVTILPEEEYSSMQETLILLADKEDLLTEKEWKIAATTSSLMRRLEK
jgi:PHD/YefM family antitoxin component YafN of YafNO toxin-antitoxin module